MRPYIQIEKTLVFAFCLSVHHEIVVAEIIRFTLIWGKKFYLLLEISCTVFGVHCPNRTCTEIFQYKDKNISIQYNLRRKYVCIFPVYLWRDNVREKYSIDLKFSTIVFVLWKISCNVFRAHFPNDVHTEILKSSSMHYVPLRKFFKTIFDMVIVHKN